MLLPEHLLTKFTIDNKAEAYSTNRHGYSNENQEYYEKAKEDYKNGYKQALIDLSLYFEELSK